MPTSHSWNNTYMHGDCFAPIDTVRALQGAEVLARGVNRVIGGTRPAQNVSGTYMENLGVQNVGDALFRMAGTQVRDYGGIGGMKTVSVRSLGAAHTGVVYDGLPVSDCQAGQIDVGRFFVENLSEIMLSVGQETDVLQSASQLASGAVLRLTGAFPRFISDNRHALTAIVKVGAWGEVSPALMYGYRSRTGNMLGVNAAYSRADGHYPFTLQNGRDALHERRANTDINSGNIEFNWAGEIWHGGHFEAKAYGYASERGLPGAAIYYNNVSHQRLWDANVFAQMRLTQQMDDIWRVQARAKFNYSYNKYEDTGSKYPGGRQRDVYYQNEAYLSATVMCSPMRCLDLSLAEDVRLNTLNISAGMSRYEPQPRRWTSLTALQARYCIPHLSIDGSLLMSVFDERVCQGKAMDGHQHLSPSLAVSVRPWLLQRFYCRAMYKSTFRMPSFNDLYYDKIGNTALVPEKAQEYSIGIAWEMMDRQVWWKELSVTVDAYMHRVEDKIVAMPGVYVWKMVNYGRVHVSGLDATLHSRWDVAMCSLTVDAAYTYQRAVDRTDPASNTYGGQLPYTPCHSGNVSAQLETPWLCFGWNIQMMGERYVLAVNTLANRMSPYTVHDLNVWRVFKMRGCHLRLQLGLSNIGDRSYDVIRYYPMPGRCYRATVKLML